MFDRYKKSNLFRLDFLILILTTHWALKERRFYGIVDWILLLSRATFHQQNFIEEIIQILLNNNGYSLNFIFSSIQTRIKFHYNNNVNFTNK